MNRPDNRSKSCGGFSLLELLTVIVLIGILVTIGITRIAESSDVAKEKTCAHHRTQINSALERFAITNGTFATAIGDVDTSEYFPGSIPTCAVNGSAYTLNTTTHRVEGHANGGSH